MSYDLFLKPRSKQFSESDFIEYFTNRKNYTVKGNEALYENEDTGVHFMFDFQSEDDFELQDDYDDDDEVDGEYYPVAFNLNYCRPSYFAYEAEPEVRSFINRYSMFINDPQEDGIGLKEYSPTGFLRSWAYGNESSYAIIVAQEEKATTLPAKLLGSVWEWNYNKAKLQDSIIEDVFVPRIMLLSYLGTVVTAIVWADAIPTLIPEVDIVVFHRKALAPRKLFRKPTDIAIGKWSEFQPLLEKHHLKMLENAYFLFYETVPQDLQRAVKSLRTSKDELERLAYYQVLDSEIIQKHLAL